VSTEVGYNATKKMENCSPVAGGDKIPSHDEQRSGEIPANNMTNAERDVG
jgi:hypothetical protein